MITGHLPELLIVLTLALVVFGPKRIPEIGSSLGQGIRDFRHSLSSLDADGTQLHIATTEQHLAPVTVNQEPVPVSEARPGTNHPAS